MRIISASIDLSKITKANIKDKDKDGNPFKNGAKYYNFDVIVKDEPDKYGKDVQIVEPQTKEQREAKADRTFLGGGKTVWSSENKVSSHGTTTRDGITTKDGNDLGW